ncbi:MAG: hypothetical protein WA830_08645 [Candidatus Sulfotelmatobacter sp.]
MSFSPLLPVHISAGITGILSGAAALSFRKGSPRHVLAGKVFVIAMLTLGASAVYLALMKNQMGNVLGGTFAFYLVATAWATARRGDGETGIFDWAAMLIPLLVGIALLILGLELVYGHAKSPKGVPIGMYFVMGSVMLLAAAGDIRMLVRGGVLGAKRIVRHLWRMCFGLFIATGSFFLGQQQVFPAWLRGSSVLFVPALLPLILLIFWLFRVRFTNAYKRMSMPRGGDVNSLRT